MTPQEYGQLAEWYAEGRLEVNFAGAWHECTKLPTYGTGYSFHCYRRRPDAPTMPDEVWGDPRQTSVNGGRVVIDHASLQYSVRYIRADAVIDGSRLELRIKSKAQWHEAGECEYRFKEAK